jgi:formylglycine-generating enzyme required for sulfatase activity
VSGETGRFKQDVGALAALAYEMLTGKPACREETLLHGVATDQPSSQSEPMKPQGLTEMAWVVLRQALAYHGAGCPSSAGELVRRLEVAKPSSLWSKYRTLKVLGVLLIMSVATGIGAFLLNGFDREMTSMAQAVGPASQEFSLNSNQQNTVNGLLVEPSLAVKKMPLAHDIQQHSEEQRQRTLDERAFAAAQRIDTIAAYQLYLRSCPACWHGSEAQAAIAKHQTQNQLQDLKQQFSDTLATFQWLPEPGLQQDLMGILQAIESQNPVDPFVSESRYNLTKIYSKFAEQSLLQQNYADARHWLNQATAMKSPLPALAALQDRLNQSESKTQDRVAYQTAKKQNPRQAYQLYLDNCAPLCGHSRQASAAITALDAAAMLRDSLADGGYGPELVTLSPGVGVLGAAANERGRFQIEQQQVSVKQGFAIGRYEVTFAEYDRFAEATGREKPKDEGWGRGQRPVINVSWHDAVAYTDWLSAQTGHHYRLPTEAEWEYAARAETATAYHWGDNPDQGCQYANGAGLEIKNIYQSWTVMQCNDNYLYTAPVGNYKTNYFGLYDMVGNVLEWTCSAFGKVYDLTQRCQVKQNHRFFVARGGSWSDEPGNLKMADRYKAAPNSKEYFLGFRVVRQL